MPCRWRIDGKHTNKFRLPTRIAFHFLKCIDVFCTKAEIVAVWAAHGAGADDHVLLHNLAPGPAGCVS